MSTAYLKVFLKRDVLITQEFLKRNTLTTFLPYNTLKTPFTQICMKHGYRHVCENAELYLPVSLPIKGWFAKCMTNSFKLENSLNPNLSEVPVYSTWKCFTESFPLQQKRKSCRGLVKDTWHVKSLNNSYYWGKSSTKSILAVILLLLVSLTYSRYIWKSYWWRKHTCWFTDEDSKSHKRSR